MTLLEQLEELVASNYRQKQMERKSPLGRPRPDMDRKSPLTEEKEDLDERKSPLGKPRPKEMMERKSPLLREEEELEKKPKKYKPLPGEVIEMMIAEEDKGDMPNRTPAQESSQLSIDEIIQNILKRKQTQE